MKRIIRGAILPSIGLWAALTLPASAKPPGLPSAPETEFLVLSPLAQEFNQADEPPAVSVFVPQASWLPGSAAVGALGGAWTRLCEWNDAGATARAAYLAKELLGMAETYRKAGNWDEAQRWYEGVKQLFPGRAEAKLAQAQLVRLAYWRIATEAWGQPRFASAERLTIMPREVR